MFNESHQDCLENMALENINSGADLTETFRAYGLHYGEYVAKDW